MPRRVSEGKKANWRLIIGVVLFVQLMPKILKADMKKEVANLEAAAGVTERAYAGKTFKLDAAGIFSLLVSIIFTRFGKGCGGEEG